MRIQAEVTSYCSLECAHCANAFMKRQRHMMGFPVWDAIMRKYAVPYHRKNEHLGPPTLIPSKDGESLLNKQFPNFLSLAAELVPDMQIDVYTNGLQFPLLKFNFLDFLGSLPNKCRLVVSFHFTNHDGSTNDYRATSAWLKKALRRKPANVEVVFLSHLIAPQTRERLSEWKESWREEIRAQKVSVRIGVGVSPWAGAMKDVATYEHRGCLYKDFGTLVVGATGNVVSCSLDLDEEIVHGNVMEDDPEKVMARLEAFYQARRYGKPGHPLCWDCYGKGPRLDKVQPDLIQIGGVR